MRKSHGSEPLFRGGGGAWGGEVRRREGGGWVSRL